MLSDLTGWTLDRTADIPKCHRHTFGQRLDNLCLDALMVLTAALYSPPAEKPKLLRRLNLLLEQMRVLWRLVEERTWISGRQCLHVNSRIDEAGRMVGAWLKSMNREA